MPRYTLWASFLLAFYGHRPTPVCQAAENARRSVVRDLIARLVCHGSVQEGGYAVVRGWSQALLRTALPVTTNLKQYAGNTPSKWALCPGIHFLNMLS